MTDDLLNRDPVENLAEEFVSRHRDGESPSIEEYAQRYPELADEIRDLFPTIAKLERLKLQKSGSSNGRAASGLSMLSQLGDYRIVREIGRGGMGIVYEAEQLSLKRRVALKVLGANIAGSTKQYRRFQREAEAAARLHHTNIVPIFGIGEEHGIHFFAMQLIDGVPLSELIEYRCAHWADSEGVGTLTRGDVDSIDGPLPFEQPTATVADQLDTPASTVNAVRLDASGEQPVALSPSGASAATNRTSTSTANSPFRVTLVTPSTGDPIPRVIVSQATGTQRSPVDVPGWNSHRDVARIGMVLADALAYAHLHGILHRDVKPANILMDTDGVVYMTDFGLARHLDQAGLTNTGDVLGTLRYMAPEQFHGDADFRADIYSLGLTIYEILAGRPAFMETQQGPLIQQKGEHAIPPLRSLNPSIPRDLETIVMKACAAEPEQRYHSASALGADLKRFLDDRPIVARRTTLIERSWRWTRRNRMVAALGSLAILLLAAVAITFGIGNYRTNEALSQADNQRANAVSALRFARQEAARAESNMQLAVQAFDEIILNISGRGVPQSLQVDVEGVESAIPETIVTDADAALLTSLLRFFDKFSAENGTDFSEETANARRRIGDIQLRLGKLDESEAAYQSALDTFGHLSPGEDSTHDHVLDAAKTWNQIGVVRSRRGEFWGAISAHREAFGMLEDSGIVQTHDAAKLELAETINLIGSVGARSGALDLLAEIDWRRPESFGHRGPGDGRRGDGRSEEGRSNGEGRPRDGGPGEGRQDGGGEPRADGDRPDPMRDPEGRRGSRGGGRRPEPPLMLNDNGRDPDRERGKESQPPAEGEASPLEPLPLEPWNRPGFPFASPDGPLPGPRPGPPPARDPDSGRPPGPPSRIGSTGGVPFNLATEMLQQLVDANPDNPEYRLALARSFRNRMLWSGQRGFRPESTSPTSESEAASIAIRLLEQLIEDFPDSPSYQFELADTLCLSVRQGRKEQRPEQIRTLQRAVTLAENLLNGHPNINEYQALLGGAERKLSTLQFREGNYPAAGSGYQRALELQRPLAERFPMVAIHQVAFAQGLAGQAELLQRLGQKEGAVRSLETAIRVAEATLERRTDDHFLRRFVEKLHRDRDRLESPSPNTPSSPIPATT